MFRIVRNCWIDSLRSSRQSAGHTDASEAENELAVDGESAVLSKLTLAAVLKTVDKLPKEQREVLMLVCVEDFSYAEAAQVLDIPIGTVMSRLARARTKIIKSPGIGS